jgi:hypothetical protein
VRNTVGVVQLLYEGERLGTDMEWSREVGASGAGGGYTLTQGLSWDLSYSLTESTSLTAGSARARVLDIGRGTGGSVGFGVRSELSPFWSMAVRFERVRASTAGGETARGNSVSVGFVYAHPDL